MDARRAADRLTRQMLGEAFEPPDIDAEEGGAADPQPTNEVQLGDLAYWSPGNTLNFYCGDTPLTSVRPLKEGERNPLISSSAVTVVGQLDVEGAVEFNPKEVARIEVRKA